MPCGCPICMSQSEWLPQTGDFLDIDCPQCGHFLLANTAHEIFEKYKEERRREQGLATIKRQIAIVSSLIRERWQKVLITEEEISQMLSARDISVSDKMNKLLLIIADASPRVGDAALLFRQIQRNGFGTSIVRPDCLSRAWIQDDREFNGLLGLIAELGLIYMASNRTIIKLTAKGWERVEQLSSLNMDSPQGFVAMWFNEAINHVYSDSIAKAITQAGYQPLRVDQREHNNKIDDEIIVQIKRSRFVVADLTEHRGGVYYEAGFAEGLGLPVFLTCNENDTKDIHFDIRQYNYIKWSYDKLDLFKEQLAARIEAVIGRGSSAIVIKD